MATSKTLTPTNVTIQIPEFTDQPDQRVNNNCIDKEADAINALNGNLSALSDKASYIYDGANFATLKAFILWVKTQAGNSNKIHYGRVEAMSTDNPFGTSSFNYFFSFSSANYGWIHCFADKRDGGVVHIAVNGSTAYLQKPTITTTNYSLE